MSDSVWPHRQQPTRLPHPWDSPGKNTGVGCCFLLQCMKVKNESKVAQSCSTLRLLPGSSIHGIFQARVLEWGAIAFSNPRTARSCIFWLLPDFPEWPQTCLLVGSPAISCLSPYSPSDHRFGGWFSLPSAPFFDSSHQFSTEAEKLSLTLSWS